MSMGVLCRLDRQSHFEMVFSVLEAWCQLRCVEWHNLARHSWIIYAIANRGRKPCESSAGHRFKSAVACSSSSEEILGYIASTAKRPKPRLPTESLTWHLRVDCPYIVTVINRCTVSSSDVIASSCACAAPYRKVGALC